VGGPLDGGRTVRVRVKLGLDRSAEELAGARCGAEGSGGSPWDVRDLIRDWSRVRVWLGSCSVVWRGFGGPAEGGVGVFGGTVELTFAAEFRSLENENESETEKSLFQGRSGRRELAMS